MPPARSYQFGSFRLDAGGRVLYRDGDRVTVTPKAVDLLVVLVQARGEPVAKDDLLTRVWAGTVVEEGSLTTHISILRRILGDGYIETLSKRGYRFVGTVDTDEDVASGGKAPRTNLPPALNAFIGREQALGDVRDQVRRSRLVTLVGSGGTGKTRLSIEAARALAAGFPDSVWLVELAPIAEASLVAHAIAGTLGARAESNTPPMTLIESALQGRRALLLLDNCEHVIDEVAAIARALLRSLPEVHILATSREPLAIEGEVTYRVPSLTPEEAERLFVDRAVAVEPRFALNERNALAVAQVCRRLDGIPLAIELAAARLKALSVEEIARRIDDRFSLLKGGQRSALPRHRTLRALVDWSYDLLPEAERSVLRTLSVFAGDFSLDAAARVCDGDAAEVLDAVEPLVAKSLVIAQTRDGSETRYRMLETIRQYATEKLVEAGLLDLVRRRHFACFEELASAGNLALRGPQALDWIDRIEAEHDNLRAALDWSAEADATGHARLAGTLAFFWDTRGYYTEGLGRIERALAAHAPRDPVRLEALIGAGALAHRLAHARSHGLLCEAVALAQELRDVAREGLATFWLATNRLHLEGPDPFEKLLRRALSLARSAADRHLEAMVLRELSRAALDRGELAAGRALSVESAKLCDEIGYILEAPSAIHHQGQFALEQVDFADARRLLEDALARNRRIGNVHDVAGSMWLLGRLALNEGRLDDARALTAEGLRVFRSLHDPKCEAKTALVHASVLHAMGDGAAALPHAESAVSTYRELDFPDYLAQALCTVGCIHAAMGQRDAARQALFGGLTEQRRAVRDTHLPALFEAVAGMNPGEPVAAQLLGTAQAVRERLNVPLLPRDRAERERLLAEVRAQQARGAFDQAFAAGHGLARDDAIESALALL